MPRVFNVAKSKGQGYESENKYSQQIGVHGAHHVNLLKVPIQGERYRLDEASGTCHLLDNDAAVEVDAEDDQNTLCLPSLKKVGGNVEKL